MDYNKILPARSLHMVHILLWNVKKQNQRSFKNKEGGIATTHTINHITKSAIRMIFLGKKINNQPEQGRENSKEFFFFTKKKVYAKFHWFNWVKFPVHHVLTE